MAAGGWLLEKHPPIPKPPAYFAPVSANRQGHTFLHVLNFLLSSDLKESILGVQVLAADQALRLLPQSLQHADERQNPEQWCIVAFADCRNLV